jgi:hypothetical protein
MFLSLIQGGISHCADVLTSAVLRSSVMRPSAEEISDCSSNVAYVVFFFFFGLENTRGSTPVNRRSISLASAWRFFSQWGISVLTLHDALDF